MIAQILLPAALAFIMFAMGLTMALGDLKQVFLSPKAVAVGLFCKILLLPLLGVAILSLFGMGAEFAVGLLILSACPAGVTSSLLTYHAKGRIALSASVTAISSLAAAITLPFIVDLALKAYAGYGQDADLPVGKVVLGIFLVDTLPLALGLALQRWRPLLALKLGRVARPTATLLFALIVVGAFASQFQTMADHGVGLFLPVLALNLAAMACAWWMGRATALPLGDRVAIVMENGLQNSALGIFVAATLLQNQTMLAPIIIYALVMNLTALAAIAYFRRLKASLAY